MVIDLLRGFGGLIGSFGLCLCLLCGWFRLLVCGGWVVFSAVLWFRVCAVFLVLVLFVLGV